MVIFTSLDVRLCLSHGQIETCSSLLRPYIRAAPAFTQTRPSPTWCILVNGKARRKIRVPLLHMRPTRSHLACFMMLLFKNGALTTFFHAMGDRDLLHGDATWGYIIPVNYTFRNSLSGLPREPSLMEYTVSVVRSILDGIANGVRFHLDRKSSETPFSHATHVNHHLHGITHDCRYSPCTVSGGERDNFRFGDPSCRIQNAPQGEPYGPDKL